MTQDHHDLEFERFSEHLDLDPSNPKLGREGELLLNLREALQSEESFDLPKDFAATTATQVRQRFTALPLPERLYFRSSAFFLGRALTARSLAAAGGLTGLGLGLAYLSWPALLTSAASLLLFCLIWMGKSARVGEFRRTFSLSGQRLGAACFYLMPILATLSTGVLAGAGLYSLASFSYSFRESEENLALIAVFGGLATALMLLLALLPVWRYFRVKIHDKLGIQLLHHALYGAWLVGAGALILSLTGFLDKIGDPRFWVNNLVTPANFGWSVFGICLLLGLVSWLCPARLSESPDGRMAFKRTFSSLLASGFLISGALLMFYQVHLTREIYEQNAYEQTIAEAEALLAEELAVAPEDNGWLEVQRIMVRPYIHEVSEAKRNMKLKALTPFVGTRYDRDGNPGTYDHQEWESAKSSFLEELPSIERALDKPRFSTVATEGFGFEKQAPDFIAYRSVTQGLALLSQESLEEGRTQDFLHYAKLNLEWANKEKSLSLIGLLIRVAMTAIILEPLEQAILDGQLSEQELNQLAEFLQKNRPQTSALRTAMLGELLLFESGMKRLIQGGFRDREAIFDGSEELWGPRLLTLLPGYLESERKAYFNHQLSRLGEWEKLSRPATDIGLEINPFNVTSMLMIPNHTRAQSQFMLMLSRYQALEMVVALEIYRRQRGQYPGRLEDLVPELLAEIPEDPIRPEALGRKSGFEYLKDSEQSYRLQSESEVYENIGLVPRQVYGPGGNRGLRYRK